MFNILQYISCCSIYFKAQCLSGRQKGVMGGPSPPVKIAKPRPSLIGCAKVIILKDECLAYRNSKSTGRWVPVFIIREIEKCHQRADE